MSTHSKPTGKRAVTSQTDCTMSTGASSAASNMPSISNSARTLEASIGNTPLVALKKLNLNPRVRLFAKLEGNNPAGSVKDRPALGMFKQAEAEGWLKTGDKIVEATSGNTGIALAMVAAIKGYEIELVMPENATIERVKAMRAYGATVVLTPKEEGMEGAIDYARKKCDEGYINLNQFANKGNPLAHYNGTAPEIWRDTNGEITHFVSAMGTTGTITGVSKYLKEQNHAIQIVGVQPEEGESIPGIRAWPKEYLPEIYEPHRVDVIRRVTCKEATRSAQDLARMEGMLCGMSTGGAAYVALELTRTIDSGTIVFIACDRGDKYLSSDLFE